METHFEQIDTELIKAVFNAFQSKVHKEAKKKGFWPKLEGVDYENADELQEALEKSDVGGKVALCHSELSEALEALRKPIPEKDKHCPDFFNLDIELGDAVIRLFDFAAAHNIPLIDAMLAKIKYNETRPPKHGKRF
jgi:hypothetical protein